MKPVEAVLIGAGQRGTGVASWFAGEFPQELKLVAVADPIEEKRNAVAEKHNISPENCFESYDDLLAQPQLAPLCFNMTMDQTHLDSTKKILEKGYHLFLEKPMAHTPQGCLEIMELAKEKNLMVQICHPLRYTPFYRMVKDLIEKGAIGKPISYSLFENVGYWHFAHSYVRGNWRNSEKSGPIILTKCCHDMDITTWLSGQDVKWVSSFGILSHFKESNAPKGASDRCTDGCSVEDKCPFYAPAFYLGKGIEWPTSVISHDTSAEARQKALETGPYGRCVYKCDNNVPDHQVLSGEFEDGTTFDFAVRAHTYDCFRTVRITGTEGELNGHFEKGDISIDRFQQGIGEDHSSQHYRPEQVLGSHGGGDEKAIKNFLKCFKENDMESINRSLEIAVEGHILSFASEEARKNNVIIDVPEFKKSILQ